MELLRYALRRNTLFLSSQPFYRRYPPPSGTRLSWIDARGAVDFEVGFFFSRVPKSANSFVMQELFKFRSTEQEASAMVKKQYVKPSELRAGQLDALDGLFKFTFIRDPYTRTLSAYLDKIFRRQKPIKSISRHRVPSFAEFCRYLDNGGLHENIHWAPQTSILLLPVDKFDHVGRIENMDVDLPHVLGKLRDLTGRTSPADFTAADTPAAPHTPQADAAIASHYDDETTDIVTRLFAEDFRQLGYPRR